MYICSYADILNLNIDINYLILIFIMHFKYLLITRFCKKVISCQSLNVLFISHKKFNNILISDKLSLVCAHCYYFQQNLVNINICLSMCVCIFFMNVKFCSIQHCSYRHTLIANQLGCRLQQSNSKQTFSSIKFINKILLSMANFVIFHHQRDYANH